MAYEFQVTRRVEFFETDMAGIMHFSNYFRFMESAEGEFLRSLGYSVVLSRNGLDVGLPRVHAECDYSAPLRFEDEVGVHLLVEKKTARSLSYQFRFYLLNGPNPPCPVARGRVTAVCVARQKDGSMKAVPIPAMLADKIDVAPPELLADEPAPVARSKASSSKLLTPVPRASVSRAKSSALKASHLSTSQLRKPTRC
jgi:YbgC/YbaW family acyl-CoA thioester hydrolase